MENVAQITPYEKMVPWNWSDQNFQRKRINKRKSMGKAKEQFSFLADLADDTHRILSSDDSPLRLCIYQRRDDVLIDVVTQDKILKKTKHFSRVITNKNVKNIIKNIHNRQGLVLDYNL